MSEWLPDEALVAAPSLAAIDARIAAWSARWFVRPVRRQEGGGAAAGVTSQPAPRHGWRRFAPGLWLDWGEQTPQTLALHALGRAELRPKLTADDAHLLELLGERMAQDLAAGLAKAPSAVLPESGGSPGGPGRAASFRLCSASQALGLGIAIDAAVLAGLRKQQCPPWRPPEAKRLPLGQVLGSVPVAFEAALGSVRIGLIEFEGIEPGDTIVLDQPVAAPIALRATASGAALRETRLIRENGQLTLTAS